MADLVSDHCFPGYSHNVTFSSTEVSLSHSSPSYRPLPLLLPSFLTLYTHTQGGGGRGGKPSNQPILICAQTLDNDPVPAHNNNQWQSRPLLEWTNQQVCLWLIGMNMDQYAAEFTARGVDGEQLLGLDSEKLKV